MCENINLLLRSVACFRLTHCASHLRLSTHLRSTRHCTTHNTLMNVLDGLTGVELDELSSSLICGLDLLEVLRYPRFVSNEDRQRETTLDTSGLMEEINCAICCGIIQKCVVIKACLHRFCSECISKAMRTG